MNEMSSKCSSNLTGEDLRPKNKKYSKSSEQVGLSATTKQYEQ